MSAELDRLTAISKLKLASRIWLLYAVVVFGLWRWQLPELVKRLARRRDRARNDSLEPRRLGRIVARVLRVGQFRARCLLSSLVLLRLLQERGLSAELVIGLPGKPKGHEAHAWVEVDGEVVGPPPGRLGHGELARYGGRRKANRRARAQG